MADGVRKERRWRMVEREDGWLVGRRGRMKRHDNSRREETANEMKTVKTRGGSRRFMEHVEDRSRLRKER